MSLSAERIVCDDLLAKHGYQRGADGEFLDGYTVRVLAAMIDEINGRL